MAERERDLMEVGENDNIENMYLTFMVEKETYAVNIGCVTEIAPPSSCSIWKVCRPGW